MNCVVRFIRELALMVLTTLIIVAVFESAKIVFGKSSHCVENVKKEAAQ